MVVQVPLIGQHFPTTRAARFKSVDDGHNGEYAKSRSPVLVTRLPGVSGCPLPTAHADEHVDAYKIIPPEHYQAEVLPVLKSFNVHGLIPLC